MLIDQLKLLNMKHSISVTKLSLIFLNFMIQVAYSRKNFENDLIKVLLTDYDSTIRPVMNEKDYINITISMNSFSLLSVDQAAETIVFSAEFILEWSDAFLRWDRAKYNNLTWLKLKEVQIWRPDVTVSTSINKISLLDEKENYLDVRYDGLIRQSSYAVHTNLCNMQVTRFPYDSQVCRILIGPWSYTTDEVLCRTGPDLINEESFSGNSEWDFVGLNNSIRWSVDPDVAFEYTEVQFTLIVKRRPLFYVWVLLIPTFIITTTCLCGLFSPSNNVGDREEKVNIGLSTLLSSTVILQIIATSMPKTSVLPLLGNFILAEIFVVSIGVFFAVFVLFLHNKAHTRGWNPPNWILTVLRLSGSRKFLMNKGNTMKECKMNTEDQILSFTGESSEFFTEFNSTLNNLTKFIQGERRNRVRELTWRKLFDRLDMLLLIIFQTTNAIVTFLICK